MAKQVVEFLQFLVRKGEHGFTRIEFLSLRADNTAELATIYPTSRKNWSGFDPSVYAGMTIHFADVSKPLPKDKWPGNK